MIIRDILESELGTLIDLYADYTAAENLPTLSGERIQEIWRQINDNPGVHYFVLEFEGKSPPRASSPSPCPSFVAAAPMASSITSSPTTTSAAKTSPVR
jgi:hypothetical protein